MMTMPPFDTLYAALCARDAAFEGRAWVGVTSTGIFCRLTCPARKPKAANCRFLPSVARCMEEGYRPCKRCHPLRPAGTADPLIAKLVTALEATPDRRWTERCVAAMGHDPSTVRRVFKRHYGMTFLDMARQTRLRRGFEALKAGERVIDAQLEAGFDSASGFRTAFARLLGVAPGHLTGQELLRADWIATPLGPMIAVADQRSLHLLEFLDRKALPAELKKLRAAARGSLGLGRLPPTDWIATELERYFAGHLGRFETPVTLHGTPFARQVWQALREIPAGETRSYSRIARQIGRPEAVRAVARANGTNQLALIVPCHRVIGSDGSLTGYGGGLWRKERLIALERQSGAGGGVETDSTISSGTEDQATPNPDVAAQ